MIGRALALTFVLTVACAPALGATAVLTGPPPRAITDPRSCLGRRQTAADPAPSGTSSMRAAASSQMERRWPERHRLHQSHRPFQPVEDSAAGGFPVQLSQSDDRQSGIAIFARRQDSGLPVRSRRRRDFRSLHVPLNGGPVVNLTNTPDESESSAHFSHDGKTLAL